MEQQVPDPQSVYEKLGVFYLGRESDVAAGRRTALPLLYDSRDLVTHAVCVGMTGSGKTGLCIGLLEEAAIDGIPAIIIDPKGDLANLLLAFPDLRPEDFRPWVNPDDARRKEMDPDAFAARQAGAWREGLENWAQSGERIARFRGAAEFSIYTPGSSAGLEVSVLKSFDAPAESIRSDAELLRERVSGVVSGLLALLNLDADPVTSREHIFLSSLLAAAWTTGESLDLPALIGRIQHPPFARLGVMELETVFPARERFELALRLNTLVASPGFAAWTRGESLDVQSLLYTAEGKPRVSIFSIAHLGDSERMFFVSLLLNRVLGWVREQPGTSSLRAILYMDEIAGYFPPVANPPSKQPLLTLMKQARAFGVGVVLATQNPVDLDYKGLANAGTWFIGRLQTDRDKQRVLDGLEGAAGGGFDRARMDSLLSGLSPRVFLMQNVHDPAPTLFETRWCLSYLAGPLTRAQIKLLMDPRKTPPSTPAETSLHQARTPGPEPAPSRAGKSISPADPAPANTAARSHASADSLPGARPVLPPGIPQYFLPVGGQTPVYEAHLLGTARVYYDEPRYAVKLERDAGLLAPIVSGPVVVDWDHAEATSLTDRDLLPEPAPGATFLPLNPKAVDQKTFDGWKRRFADAVQRQDRLTLLRSASLKETSRPGETERDFRIRLAILAREERDRASEALREKYAPRFAALQERLRRAQQTLEVQKQQAGGAGFQAAISAGAAILGAFLGRKVASAGNVGRAATAARRAQRTVKERGDVERAQETLEAVAHQMHTLEAQMQSDLDELTLELQHLGADVQPLEIKPKKTGISVRAVVLAWRAEGS